jgi:hypothetical protein
VNNYFFVVNSFEHLIDCFCGECQNRFIWQFNKEDKIEVSEERKYVPNIGWFVLTYINEKDQLFIAIEDLERYRKEGSITSTIDKELELNFLRHSIDRALDEGDEKQFDIYVKEYEKLGSQLRVLNNSPKGNFITF